MKKLTEICGNYVTMNLFYKYDINAENFINYIKPLIEHVKLNDRGVCIDIYDLISKIYDPEQLEWM